MAPPLAPSKHKNIVTYGRSSRSKVPAFKVFQDAAYEEMAEKKVKKHPVVSEDYSHLTNSPTRSLSPMTGEDADDPISEDEDPFTDTAASLNFRLKPPPTPVPKRRHKEKGAGSNSIPPNEESGGNRFKMPALADKSTNYPILPRPTATAGLTRGSVEATSLLRLKREARPTPVTYPKKKPKLGPQITPRPILTFEPPMRPRKPRKAGPSLEDQDFPTILSPSKARNPDSKSHFRRFSGMPDNGSDRPYNEPPIAGITGIGSDDSSGIFSGAWVRDRAKGIFNGTKKAAERVLGVSPQSSRYKHQRRRSEPPKLKDMEHMVVEKRYGTVKHIDITETVQKGRIRNISSPDPAALESSDGDDVSLQDFLEDPFSSPDDFEPSQDQEYSLGTNGGRSRLWKTESTQDLLVLGSTKIRHARKVSTLNQANLRSGEEEDDDDDSMAWDNLSSFLATTNLSPGTRFKFNYSGSDNEMPSSSPVANSTPKKDWNYYEDPSTRGNGHNMIIALGSSDTDRLEGFSVGKHYGGGDGNENDGNNWEGGDEEGSDVYLECNKKKIPGKTKDQKQHEKKHPVLRAASSGDEFYYNPSGVRIFNRGFAEKVQDRYSLKTNTDEASGNERGEYDRTRSSTLVLKKTNSIDLRERPSAKGGGGGGGGIHFGGPRTGTRVSKDKKYKATGKAEIIAANCGDSRSNRPKTASKETAASRSTGKKKRRSFLGFNRMAADDVDELQMDLPEVRI